ncbi:MAG TPA: zinc-dependent metalloprotease [Candidatus Limnocylindria bacterium]|nr:zinc-dependent metalloprotease [Candidatus Limnocylindria bacterium]
MTNTPFGFGLPQDPDDDDETRSGDSNPFGAGNPLAALFGAAGGGPADLGAALQQIGKLLSYEGGPVNWDLARDTARQTVAAAGDRSVSDAERRAVDEAVRLAEVWLDGATGLPAATTGAQAWSRAEWVEGTLPAWQRLVEPVARKVVETAGTAIPEEMQAMAGPMVGMAQQLTGAMFGGQVGQGVGQLAGEVVTGTDVGLPLGPIGTAVLVPQNVAEFGAGLEVPEEEVRLYLALREAAHHRLFAHVSWLDAALHHAVADYAAGITVDTGRLEELVRGIDPNDMSQVQGALTEGMLAPEDTPAQRQALARLETLLALVEGWVDAVVTTAAATLPSAAALRETVRRRRATGGPAEQTFATLVGLELRPRRLRDAAALWEELASARGTEGRDAVWEHPDLLPTADDLDDPAGFVAGGAGAALDLSGLDDLPPSAAGPESSGPDAPEPGTATS